jgi:hypothetical protein
MLSPHVSLAVLRCSVKDAVLVRLVLIRLVMIVRSAKVAYCRHTLVCNGTLITSLQRLMPWHHYFIIEGEKSWLEAAKQAARLATSGYQPLSVAFL